MAPLFAASRWGGVGFLEEGEGGSLVDLSRRYLGIRGGGGGGYSARRYEEQSFDLFF